VKTAVFWGGMPCSLAGRYHCTIVLSQPDATYHLYLTRDLKISEETNVNKPKVSKRITYIVQDIFYLFGYANIL
jgi:hypothetical protein